MKALAWDDKKEDYMVPLSIQLAKYHIDLKVTDDSTEFSELFMNEQWDFIIVDLIEEGKEVLGEIEVTGQILARQVANHPSSKHIPIIIVTSFPQKIDYQMIGIPQNAIIKHKSLFPPWAAVDIVDHLRKLGLYTNSKNVFLIYGHDRDADGATGEVDHFLKGKGINVVTISGENLRVHIANGLLEKMNECAAIIAICTPDDQLTDSTCHPRQNVLLEIGMAMGLSRGIHRLTILQRWGPAPANKAVLPSDLDGILTIRFKGEISRIFDQLESRLKLLGVEIY